MRYSCLHTHTNFCDGDDDVETICRAAYEQGLVSVGFSSHAPIRRKTGLSSDWHLRDERLEEYLDAVRAARRRWAGKLPVFLGLEADYIRGLTGPADRDYRDMGLDYLIGSVHYVIPPNGREPFTVDGPREEFERDLRENFDGDGEALMEAYWEAVRDMLREGGFDILGHLDLIKKNNPRQEWFSPEGERYLRQTARIADPVAASGVVVELNTGGLNRGKTTEPYPSPGILGLLREKNVPIIITADAHRAGHLRSHYDTARQALLDAGYTRTVLFGGRRDGKPVWNDEAL
ncbi:MAG: histidinol-phosphatase [Treponema sp.]|jgi:histidinol-phosphatase (PHP family)|nr:histidinol-phosphatase [Treponema sp.]